MKKKLPKKKAVELFDKNILETLDIGTFNCLSIIHKYLFEDIYEFAGIIRDINISKGNFRFVSVMYLSEVLMKIDAMLQNNIDQIIEKYIEMNIAHPFREGNGRSTRIWLDLILKEQLQKVIDWSQIDKKDYLLAMKRSSVKDVEIKELIKKV